MTNVARRLHVATWQVTLAVALLGLGFLIAAQVRSEAPQVQYTSQQRPVLLQNIQVLQNQHDQLQAEIKQLRDEIDQLRRTGQGSQTEIAALMGQLQQVNVAAGFVALDGPGLVVQVQDALTGSIPNGANAGDYRVSAADVRVVVNEMWRAGAEAIAVNGERVVTSTAIIDAGGSVLVNSAYLQSPYQVAAIGPKDLYDRLHRSSGLAQWAVSRVDPFGLRVDYAIRPSISIPAYLGTAGLRYGAPLLSPVPTGASSAAP